MSSQKWKELLSEALWTHHTLTRRREELVGSGDGDDLYNSLFLLLFKFIILLLFINIYILFILFYSMNEFILTKQANELR